MTVAEILDELHEELAEANAEAVAYLDLMDVDPGDDHHVEAATEMRLSTGTAIVNSVTAFTSLAWQRALLAMASQLDPTGADEFEWQTEVPGTWR